MTRQFPYTPSPYGAPMGRANSYPSILPVGKLRCFRVRLDAGGYDDGGAYWGIGAPLYRLEDVEDFVRHVRAYSRRDAIAAVGLKFGGPLQLARPIHF